MDRPHSSSQRHPPPARSPLVLRLRAARRVASRNKGRPSRQRPASRPCRSNLETQGRRPHRPLERSERSSSPLAETPTSRSYHQTRSRRLSAWESHPPGALAPSESSLAPRPRARDPPLETSSPHTPPRVDTPVSPYRAPPSHLTTKTPSYATTPWCRRHGSRHRADVVVRMQPGQSSREDQQELCACHACYQADKLALKRIAPGTAYHRCTTTRYR